MRGSDKCSARVGNVMPAQGCKLSALIGLVVYLQTDLDPAVTLHGAPTTFSCFSRTEWLATLQFSCFHMLAAPPLC